MYVTPFICYSCRNPEVAHASKRFIPLTEGEPTVEERFKLIGLGDKYSQFSKLVGVGTGDREAFKKLKLSTKYEEYIATENQKIDPVTAYALLNINRECCRRSVMMLPVWPNYNPQKPAGSSVSIDDGSIKRFVYQSGSDFVKIQVRPGQSIIAQELPEGVEQPELATAAELEELEV